MSNKIFIKVLFLLLIFSTHCFSQAGIGTTTLTTDVIFNVEGTDGGLLIPRITKQDRQSIPNPATGLLIYQEDEQEGFYFYNGQIWSMFQVNLKLDVLLDAQSDQGFSSVYLGKEAGIYDDQSDNRNVGISLNALHSIRSGSNNVGVGVNSGANINTGNSNTTFGFSTLSNNVVGKNNIALGFSAQSQSTGSNNIGLGAYSLNANTQGIHNIGVGSYAGSQNQFGVYNIAIGREALQRNKTDNNIALGTYAMEENIGGQGNIGFGAYSLRSNTYGERNTAIGYDALADNLTGSNKTSLGIGAQEASEDINDNVAIGLSALTNNVSGIHNTGIGNNTLKNTINGANNTAVGFAAMSNGTGISSSIGLGAFSLQNNQGDNNVAIGVRSIHYDSNSNSNICIGNNTLRFVSLGNQSIAIGHNALQDLKEGNENIAVGYEALTETTSGNYNTAIGHSLIKNTTGSKNTGIGDYTFENLVSDSCNTVIGVESFTTSYSSNYITLAGASSNIILPDIVNSTSIGYDRNAAYENEIRLGTNITAISGQVPYSTYSDGRIKANITSLEKGLEFIKNLRPVTYMFDREAQNIIEGLPYDSEAISSIDESKQSGFIAQEVHASAINADYDFSGVAIPKRENDLYGLSYATFVVPLVNAVQEQQALIQEYVTQISMLRARIEVLKTQIIN